MTLRLCKDCEHFVPYDKSCLKSPQPMDFVTGDSRGFFSAQSERETIHGCGKEARLFEQKAAA